MLAFNSAVSARLYSNRGSGDDNSHLVDYDHVTQAINDNNKLIVDVREPDELKELGQIPSAVNIPLGTVSTALGTMSEQEFKKRYDRSKPSRDTEIIFYCQIGRRSQAAQTDALKLGYHNAKNYIGSFGEWSNKKT